MVRIAVIGCGQWGLNYLRVMNSLEGSRVVAACDLSSERLERAGEAIPGVRTTTSAEEVLSDPKVDAVVVATPATAHYPVVKAALAAGKDCLVEKPLTTEPAEARDLRDLAAATGRVLMVGHIFKYNAAINFVQQLVAGGGIGDLEYLYFTRTNLGPIRKDVNVVWDLVTHDVSILLHFLHRSPSWISAQGASFLAEGCEDVAFATLGFDHGVIANIRASWLDPRKVREITLVGTRRMVVFNDLDASEPVRIFDKGTMQEPDYRSFGDFKMVTRNGDVVSPAIPASEPLQNQCRAFLDSVKTRQTPLSDAEDGVRVVEIVTAINRSIAERGAPVSLVPLTSTA
jgi:predicted dehydrogenase